MSVWAKMLKAVPRKQHIKPSKGTFKIHRKEVRDGR